MQIYKKKFKFNKKSLIGSGPVVFLLRAMVDSNLAPFIKIWRIVPSMCNIFFVGCCTINFCRFYRHLYLSDSFTCIVFDQLPSVLYKFFQRGVGEGLTQVAINHRLIQNLQTSIPKWTHFICPNYVGLFFLFYFFALSN